jgi:type II secretory pathway pseudopilin PulG
MAALLVAMSILAVMLTMAMPAWKQSVQREKETELIFRGQQYARALGLYGRKYANANPPSLDVLLEQRFLRKKYSDPITQGDFQLILAGQSVPGSTTQPGPATGRGGAAVPSNPPGGAGRGGPGAGPAPSGVPGAPTSIGAAGTTGGIIGVVSKSPDRSIRVYNGRTHYNEWAFVYTAPTQAPGAGAPGAAVPGQRGQQPGGAGRGTGPGGRGRGGPTGPGRGNLPFNPSPLGIPGRGGVGTFEPVPPEPAAPGGRGVERRQ